jgi:hypothetical protein
VLTLWLHTICLPARCSLTLCLLALPTPVLTTLQPHISAADAVPGEGGGYARLSYLLKAAQQKHLHTLTLDGGDWFSGTLFDTLAASNASADTPELAFFDYNGYDAVLLGNHLWDQGEAAVVRMLEKAERVGLGVTLLATNINLDPSSALRRFLSEDLVVVDPLAPTNPHVVIARAFLKVFDGFSVGVVVCVHLPVCASVHVPSCMCLRGYQYILTHRRALRVPTAHCVRAATARP